MSPIPRNSEPAMVMFALIFPNFFQKFLKPSAAIHQGADADARPHPRRSPSQANALRIAIAR